MKAVSELSNFGQKTIKDKAPFTFQLEGTEDEIDYIHLQCEACTTASYDPKTNKVSGVLDLGNVGVHSGTQFKEKFITVWLNPEEGEKIGRGELPTEHPLYKKGSKISVANPNKTKIQLRVFGDVKFVK